MKSLWDYKYCLLIFLFLLAVILAIGIIGLVYGKDAPQVYYGHSELFYEATTPHYVDWYAVFQEEVDKLSRCESSNNPEAIGDNGTSFGLLQFKKSTFESICVARYNYRNELMSADIQRLCSGEMIRNGLERHWTCKI